VRPTIAGPTFTVPLAIAFLCLLVTTGARQPAKVPRIGYLRATSPQAEAPLFEAFRQGLRELGYTEGQNIVIERRYASGELGRLPTLAAELVQLKVDVIVVGGTSGAIAASAIWAGSQGRTSSSNTAGRTRSTTASPG
jgi:putative ABC transport system substrate-binding protein